MNIHNQNHEEHLKSEEHLKKQDDCCSDGHSNHKIGRLKHLLPLKTLGLSALAIAATFAVASLDFSVKLKSWLSNPKTSGASKISGASVSDLIDQVIPDNGVILPITWGDLGKKMMDAGVIDEQKFNALYAERGGVDPEISRMLKENVDGQIKISPKNASSLLNILWALGLSNKNEILENGEMSDKRYGGAGNFASTGGWTLSKGDAMNHYSKHNFVSLTLEQQSLVDKVSRGVYRSCCGNSTHFPDCNHGMAMLGLLELLASQGASESQMYKAALAVNSYWFPDTYLTIAKLKQSQGAKWSKVDPREVLGSEYSSVSGFRRIKSLVNPVAPQSGGGCGV